jgi:hypothetical protein
MQPAQNKSSTYIVGEGAGSRTEAFDSRNDPELVAEFEVGAAVEKLARHTYGLLSFENAFLQTDLQKRVARGHVLERAFGPLFQRQLLI